MFGVPESSRLTVRMLTLIVLSAPVTALAHSFGRTYMIPVPVWMYLYGAAVALGLSFLLIAWFATSAADHGIGGERTLDGRAFTRVTRWIGSTLTAVSLIGLILAMCTALLGTRNPYMNFSMTWFWVLFVLGLAYASALFGDVYRWINPWQTLARGIGLIGRRYPEGCLSYPSRLGYWPALGLYMAFIWVELEADLTVPALGQALAAYSALNLLGVGLVGARDWFRYCEFFGVIFRLFAAMAPLALEAGGRIRLRAPCAGLVHSQAEGFSLLVFILFMLSSTTYDSLRATVPWTELFWVDLYGVLKPWAGDDPIAANHFMKPLHQIWSTAALILSPFVYLGVYLTFIAMMAAVTARRIGIGPLAMRFGPSLLPIAFVYHAAHYAPLFLTQGSKIVGLLSDPFGWGWNLFGTTHWLRANWILDAASVWHAQLALIVGGHIVSVYIAHLVALELFPQRRSAALSQVPMLALMMLYTAGGLWVLAQPIAGP